MAASKNVAAISSFVLICVVFVAVRFWRLDDSCLWFDEMFSVQAAELPWGEMFTFLSLDLVHPPAFYGLLKVWIGLGGSGVFWVRTFAVIFGCLSIIPFVLLCRELKQTAPVTLLALFLLAVNGSLIKYAQEVRMYTLLMLVSLCSLWLFARYFYRGKSFAALVLVNVLAVYIHYYSWAFIGCEILAVVVFNRAKLRQTALMAATVLAAFLPWAYVVVSAARSGYLDENIAWIKRPNFRVLFDFFFDLIEPFFFQTSSAEPASIYVVTLPILVLFFGAALAWAVTWKGDEEGKRAVWFFLIFSPVVLAAVFAASWVLPYSIWGTRHLIIIVAPTMLLAANAFCSIPSIRWRGTAIAVLVLTVSAAGLLAIRRDPPQYVWCGWEPLVGGIAQSNPNAAPVNLYASENLAAYHSWFATRGTGRFRIHIVKAPEGEFVDREYFPPRGFDGVRQADLSTITDPRLVIVYRRERPRLTEWLRLGLEAQGYQACSPQSIEFGQSTIVRMEMTRGVEGCVY